MEFTRITFTAKEKTFIKEVAHLRTVVNEKKNDIKAYGSVNKYMTKEDLNIVSVVTEAGVVKAFGYDCTEVPLEIWPCFYVSSHKGMYDGADINHDGQAYEIRRVNNLKNPLAVRPKDVDHKAIVIKTFVPHEQIMENGKVVGMTNYKPVVDIVGWVDAVAEWDNLEEPWWAKRQGTKDRVAEELKPFGLLLGQEVSA